MWKRDEGVRPVGSPSTPSSSAHGAAEPMTPAETVRPLDVANIGKSVVIKGELAGSEDLTIEGQVEGKIELRQHVLTIGANGKIKAQVLAKSVIVLGQVTGNITATEKVDIKDNGSVDGDLIAPRVAIAEGAHFRGSIDMQRSASAQSRPVPSDTKAEAKAEPKTTVPAAPATPAPVGQPAQATQR